MTSLYQCPICSRAFSRRSNLLRHSVSKQHSIVGLLSALPKRRYGFQSRVDALEANTSEVRSTGGVELMKNKLLSALMRESLRTGNYQILDVKSMSSEETSRHLFDDYEVISKNWVQGISGYICPRCLTFDYRMVSAIGLDLTMVDIHVCTPQALAQVEVIKNKGCAEPNLLGDSTDALVDLAHSVFGPEVSLSADSRRNPVYSYPNNYGNKHGKLGIGGFRAPVFKAESTQAYWWLEPAIKNKRIVLGKEDLWDFVFTVTGTYALFVIQDGSFAGIHRLELCKP
jgi:hypothetical protein